MNTFTLKMIALLLMVIDHIGLYFEGAPILFRILGRASYPLFLFCMVWGYQYTKNRKRYLIRLYAMSLFMSGFMLWIKYTFEHGNAYGLHNIFLSMFLVGVLISTFELIQKDRKKGYCMLGIIFFVQLLYYQLPALFPILNQTSGDIRTGVMMNLVLNEYGFEFVVLGVLMYFLKEKKDLFSAVYILFCISQFSSDMLQAGMPMQCFMILALPFMLQYNHQKGPGLKYFFYVFYPAHTFLLFYMANYLLGR